ncbi:MAG: hypothetical protein M3P42_08110 [Actinomycetota bacterium]|nr:hypothetical protein [Actinomycetota bacterium]
MRRVFVGVATAAAAFVVVVGAAFAGHPHATGGGTFFYGAFERLEFQAHDFGLPAADRGMANYENQTADLQYKAEIVCADVEPNLVRFGYIIPDTPATRQFGIQGFHIIWQVTDGGSPGDGNDSASYIVAADARACDTAIVPNPGNNVFKGNFAVHEEQ